MILCYIKQVFEGVIVYSVSYLPVDLHPDEESKGEGEIVETGNNGWFVVPTLPQPGKWEKYDIL